jgi:hypothetical protein
MGKRQDDPLAEAAERLKRIEERREAINLLPDGDMKTRLQHMNTAETMKAQNRVAELMDGPTKSLIERGQIAFSDWLDNKLKISETFEDVASTGVEGGAMGRADRMRHLIWTSKLAEEYGKPAAAALTSLKEVQNLFTDVFRPLKHVGGDKYGTDEIRELQFEGLAESGRDFQTNMFALSHLPKDEAGEYRAFTPDEAKDLVKDLEVAQTPLGTREVAQIPRETPSEAPQGTIVFGKPQRVMSEVDAEQERLAHTARLGLTPAAPATVDSRGQRVESEPVSEETRRRMVRTDI